MNTDNLSGNATQASHKNSKRPRSENSSPEGPAAKMPVTDQASIGGTVDLSDLPPLERIPSRHQETNNDQVNTSETLTEAAQVLSGEASTASADPSSLDRRFPIEIGGVDFSRFPTQRLLAKFIDESKPDDISISEVKRTFDRRVLLFTSSQRDYNILILADRWKLPEADKTTFFARPAPKIGKSAVVVTNVDKDVTDDEILAALRDGGFNPTSAKRLRRATDGSVTPNVKVFVNDES